MKCLCKKKNDPIFFNDYLNNKIIKIEIIDVYDGDTITAIVPILNDKFKFKCRMSGYDSPEKKPLLSKEDRNNEIYCSKISKYVLSKLTLNKKLYCRSYGLDKYGRMLIELFDENNDNINRYMIKNNLGFIYNGKTKPVIKYLENGYFIKDNKKMNIDKSIIEEYENSN